MHLWILEYLAPFILILTILVFVHELGHFIAARRYGVKVDVFSIGFGPEIIGFTDKQDTRWRFSLIPLGGYVKMFGDANVSSTHADSAFNKLDEVEKSQTLHSKTPWQKIVVAAAGPLANYLFAFVLLIALFTVKGIPVMPPIVGEVLAGVAQQAGIKPQDVIVKINAQPVEDFKDIPLIISHAQEPEIDIMVNRAGEIINFKVPLYKKLPDNKVEKIRILGIKPASHQTTFKKVSLLDAVILGIKMPIVFSVQTLQMLGKMFTERDRTKDLGGVLSIGEMASQSFKDGFFAIMWLLAVLSINLGFVNLLPIPVLDGGQIFMSTIEAIIRRPIPEKIQQYIVLLGVLLVGSLMILATWNDLSRYQVFKSIVGFFKG